MPEIFYKLALLAYPRAFRQRFGPEMLQTFRDRREDGLPPQWLDLLGGALRERTLDFMKDFMQSKTKWRIGYATATLALSLVFSATVMRAFVIPTSSMAGTLQPGDHVLVNLHPGELHRGDVITFRYPVDPNQTFIKRITGMPGDRVRIEHGQLIRNGQPVPEPYIKGTAPDFAEVTVPPAMLFVLGDNRANSLDSRNWGFLPQANVTGRPKLIYWSWPQWSRSLTLLTSRE